MKKVGLVSTLLLLLLFFAAGCTKKIPEKDPTNSQEKPAEELKMADYFPVAPNFYWEYEGIGNEFAGGRVDTEFIEGKKVQLSQQNSGTTLAKIFTVQEDGVKLVYTKEESYWRINYLDIAGQEGEYYLKAPLKVGTTWQGSDATWTIESLKEKVKVPAGEFTCLKVVGKSKDNTVERYFAKGVGLVKQVFIFGGDAVMEDNLLKYGNGEKDGNLPVKKITIYYPAPDIEKLLTDVRTEKFKTGEGLAERITEILKEDKYKVLGANVSLLNFVREEQTLRLNFSRELITELNAGSAFEALKIDSIVNTYGRNFGVEGVIINVDGKGYESGHFSFGKDEILKVKK